jgi:ATP-dependent Clp protease ATP-binding subunit ClpA
MHVTATKVLEQWTERDLSAAAPELPPAFEVDEHVTRALEILGANRNLLIVGEPGVGKTALIYELIRRGHENTGSWLAGRRVLQFSFMHRVATMKDPNALRPEMQRLIDALCESGGRIVPFFRDFRLAYAFDLEAQLLTLAYRLDVPVLGEGEPETIAAIFEGVPQLEQEYVTLRLDEPDLRRASAILDGWSRHHAARTGQRVAPAALDEALHLGHRFLARSRLPRPALDLLTQVAAFVGGAREIGRADVIERFSSVHHVPAMLVDPAVPLDLAALQEQLGAELLGQPDAVTALARVIGVIKAGLSDLRRPFGVFLFAGPTGVGKTHAAQLLAQHLFGRRDRMIRLNMPDYQGEDAAGLLFGDPAAYPLPLKRGLLTQRIAGQPFAVLLLDEFEKAHEKVADRFLQLFDEGAFINGAGETIVCRSMILIATSNTGAEVHREQPLGFLSTPDEARLSLELERRLAQRFRIELLNRFDQVVHFRPLSRADVRTIAGRELRALQDRIGFKRISLPVDVDDVVLDWLAVHGYDPRFGARFLRRALEREVTGALATLLVCGPVPPGARALLTVRRNRITARLLRADVPARPKREAVTLPAGRATETRKLDRVALLKKAEALLAAAAAPRAAFDRKREEAKLLLDRINAPSFWENSAEARQILDRYRALDVDIHVEERFARAIGQLDVLLRDGTELDVRRLARAVEAAADAVQQWSDRLLDEGARAVWVMIERADPFQPVEPWLLDLARIELAWCRRVHLETAVVAWEQVDGELIRLVLLAEGPGAGAYLEAEAGIHRRAGRSGPDLRARIVVFARGEDAAPMRPRITTVRPRRGPLGQSGTCTGRLELPASGIVVDLAGTDGETLAELLADLQAHRLTRRQESADVARVYSKDGVAARDPRTGATVLRQRDLLKGELQGFLDAWRSRGPSTGASA